MKSFTSKQQIFEYLKEKFLTKEVKGIVIQGSTAKNEIKEFSDIDCVIFNEKKIKPYYELATLNNKLFLISIYFYKAGKELQLPKNAIIIYGKYFHQIEHRGNLQYSTKEKQIRDNQMLIDLLFKYARHHNKKLLNSIDKYSNI